MQGLSSNLSLFCNEFINKFNNTGAHMLDSIYHRTLKLLKNRENVKILPSFRTSLSNITQSVNH